MKKINERVSVNDEKENQLILSDKPIDKNEQDNFHFKSRIVDKIYQFLIENPILPLTIAITGEWGIGKSSVINLLRNEIKKNNDNLVICFDPLLEGKLEIPDMINLFYLHLYKQVEDNDIKNIIRKFFESIESIMMLARIKVRVKLLGVEIEKDLGKDIDDIMKLCEKTGTNLFSEQAKELNDALKNSGKKIYLIIDEIDRLTAEQIVNFLMFARTLELFDNLICIVGMDYKQVLNKLCDEKYLNLEKHGAATAKAYLDKLFQCRFHVEVYESGLKEFAKKLLKKIDKDGLMEEITNPESTVDLSGILKILSTPRQIKKWVITTKLYYPLIKHAPDIARLQLMTLLAEITKDPVILDDIDPYEKKPNMFENMQNDKKLNEGANKDQKYRVRKNYSNIPLYIIYLLKKSYNADCEKAYGNFFEGDINKTLSLLIDNQNNLLIEDIFQFIKDTDDHVSVMIPEQRNKAVIMRLNNIFKPTTNPEIELINKLWRTTVFDEYYKTTICALCFKKLADDKTKVTVIEKIIAEADLSLSLMIIKGILKGLGIEMKDNQYNIENVTQSDWAKYEAPPLSNILDLKNIELKYIMKSWVDQVKKVLADSDSKWFDQTMLKRVFYMFDIFNASIGTNKEDSQKDLSDLFVTFLQVLKINEIDRQKVTRLLLDIKKQNNDSGEDYFKIIFNNNSDLEKCISKPQ
jgi:hypothetical protein